MHASQIVSRVLEPCLAQLHCKRRSSLVRATLGLLNSAIGSLCGIALGLQGSTGFKHRIKSVDRLLGNVDLHAQRDELYGRLARNWLEGLPQVLLVVDWSDLSKDQAWQCLRASVVVQGRSVTLYEQVHPRRKLGNSRVHAKFLDVVASMLPCGCRPIVMTDVGFQAPWFKGVGERGWYLVGGVRGRGRLRLEGSEHWIPAREMFAAARRKARRLGAGEYARSNPVEVQVVLAKRPERGRHRLTVFGRKSTAKSSLHASRAAQEPWLLVHSPGLSHLQSRAIVRLYAQRMRIEQSFRDTKNLRYGQGLEASRSRGQLRLEMLLLILHLAAIVQRLIGEAAKEQQLELQFAATRRRSRPEISVMTLARRIIRDGQDCLRRVLPCLTFSPLTQQARLACADHP